MCSGVANSVYDGVQGPKVCIVDHWNDDVNHSGGVLSKLVPLLHG